MGAVAREFVGGPYDKELRAVSELAINVIVREPGIGYWCKYTRFGEDMVYLGTGTRAKVAELKLESNQHTD